MIPHFLSPERLWALVVIPVLIMVYLLAIRMKQRITVRFTNTAVLGLIAMKRPTWVRHLTVAMALFSLGTLTMAWAQPLGIAKVPREQATIVLVIDSSRSMAAKDVVPDRFNAAKLAATKFLATLPEAFNVALVDLSGRPSLLMPPSTDRSATQRAITAMKMQDGTAIGTALEIALKAIQLNSDKSDKRPIPAMIVLLSDGANTDGTSPAHAIEIARSVKTPIYTIAYGTENGYVDLDGKRERVAPDRVLMHELAKATKGKSWDATSADQLNTVYKDIGSAVSWQEVNQPITAQYAFAALGFAVVAALGVLMMAVRWP